ncbi:NAD(P)H-dependent oxidoreductase [Methylomarinum sp. Ch1-1]|uniref:NAD(P)H-dependent oxidoreductase n=1 Tax=Methylomarinum roseum TaxID=3067653 RepID=A0AAU7NTX4_9GAMM|nr:NAD(P)H-dependent oxidoreductase [Methylomarinum sp. Ch1-1]MDP4519534.1 NAD(P)H-dependent oxidoreductase [Methylomarinum sp. Ch1-1]
MTKILAFAGSSRKQSFNKKLVAIAAQGAAKAGAKVTLIDLADYPAPIFNQDLENEQGIPDKAREFKRLLIEHDGFLIASPEYNSAFSPLLKNMIDWASRKESDDEPPLLAFKGKMAAIMATSPGGLGGLRGLMFLRLLLSNIGVTVLAEQMAIPSAVTAFAADGSLADQQQQQSVHSLGHQLVEAIVRL